MRKHLRPFLWFGFTLVTLFLVLLPRTSMGPVPVPAKRLAAISQARQLSIAMRQAALDSAQSGDKTIGWPADCGATSRDAYLARLVSREYLRPDDLAKMRAALGDFVIGNVSDGDADDVVLIASRNYADAALRKEALKGDFSFAVHKGDADSWPPARAVLPPRDPPFLAP